LLIRGADGMGQWSHCAGILADGATVIEARAFRGVVATPLGDVIDRSSEWVIVDREVDDKARGDRWALSTIGQGYDYLGAAGVPWGRDWQASGAWFCSEHNEQWQERAGLFRFVRDTRGVGPNISYRVK
jgi:uncharacterized protein YycO